MKIALLYWPLYILLLLIGLNGCDKNRIFEENEPVKNHEWKWDDVKSFRVDIQDTSLQYNIYINIRHHYLYAWRNMWVTVETQYPDSSLRTSNVELPMADAAGNFYSYCAGDLCDLQVPIQAHAVFPLKGTYTFRIHQDMRVNPLDDVFAIGLRLEAATDKKPMKATAGQH